MSGLTTTLLIIGIVVGVLCIVALIYTIAAQRRKSIALKKVDFLVEDITYKSEALNPTIEAIARITGYVEIFEAFSKKNSVAAAKYFAKNKDEIYAILERLRSNISKQNDGGKDA